MKKFQLDNDYYEIIADENRTDLFLGEQGLSLIAEYYKHKYNSEIQIVSEDPAKFSLQIINYLSKARTNPDDYRQTFIVGGNWHVVPVTYIKENGMEALFISDTQADARFGLGSFLPLIAAAQSEGIKIYSLNQTRQADGLSCKTDAILCGRDVTRFDTITKQYYIPNLLAFLAKNSYFLEENGFHVIKKLPDKLLKTAQISSFVQRYRENQGEVIPTNELIHNNEDLNEFRTRYTDKNAAILDKKHLELTNERKTILKDVLGYPRQKGLKFASIVQIQFYLNEIESELNQSLSQNERIKFIHNAKNLLKIGAPLSDFAEQFLIERQSPKQLEKANLASTQHKGSSNESTHEEEQVNVESPSPG